MPCGRPYASEHRRPAPLHDEGPAVRASARPHVAANVQPRRPEHPNPTASSRRRLPCARLVSIRRQRGENAQTRAFTTYPGCHDTTIASGFDPRAAATSVASARERAARRKISTTSASRSNWAASAASARGDVARLVATRR